MFAFRNGNVTSSENLLSANRVSSRAPAEYFFKR